MHSVQEGMWDPQPPSKHGSPLPPQLPSHPRLTHLRSATPAKRITFYKSGDSQFGGVKMAIHKRSFKCFDALLDDLSQKVPLPFGVRTVTTPHGTTKIKHLEQLEDGACYLCSDRRQVKPIDMELASKRQNIWFHNNRRSQRPNSAWATPPGHPPHRQRRILLLKNTEPWNRRTVVLSRKLTRSLRAFLDEASELLQFHVRKLYTAEGRKIDSIQSLVTCPGVLVCVGREPFSPTVVNVLRKSSEEKLGLASKSPGLGPRTPGNDARSPQHGAQSGTSEYSEGPDIKKNVNFGLETKKSIIHPRSDSSNRSARFSLSSEKSYVNSLNARPAIMNDDIEKRVLVNKDGSLSVEMKVRFRLQGEETLQWSTQIKKTPTLNSDLSLHENTASYLQHAQSGSCSDPDSVAFGPDGMEEANHSRCCYHRPERHYDLWENPVHSRKQHPVPPPHSSSRTILRHTHSSSSSSSCNSRRVVRCRAQLTNGRTSQLVQKEMRVTEQVEHRVEMEQNGDTHVEVSSVSRNCSHSKVVLVDSNVSSASSEKEDECSQYGASTCNQVIQSLKDNDEEEDLPPSASQCSHRNEQSPISPTEKDNEQQIFSEVSGASNTSPKNDRLDTHASLQANDSAHSVASLQSGTSAVCSNCGGCKRGVKRPANRKVDACENVANVSVISTKSKGTNPSNDVASVVSDGHVSRSSAAISTGSNPEAAECLAPSPTSVRSGKSCSEANGMDGERSSTPARSQLSAVSNKSLKSNCSGKAKPRERSTSLLSAKSSEASSVAKVTSHNAVDQEATKSPHLLVNCDDDVLTKCSESERSCSRCSKRLSPDATENGEIVELERPISAASNSSDQSSKSVTAAEKTLSDGDKDRCGRRSSTPFRSNCSDNNKGNGSVRGVSSCAGTVSPMSSSSVKSYHSNKTNSKRLRSATPSSNVITIPTPAVFDEDGNETTDRPQSTGSNISEKSKVSLALCEKSSANGEAGSEAEDLDRCVQDDGVLRKQGELLSPSNPQSFHLSKSPNTGGDSRVSSVLSVHSTKSSRFKCSCGTSPALDKAQSEAELGREENNLNHKSDEDFCFEEAPSSPKTRQESVGTDLPVSQNSFGSVSLGLPDDRDTADSDSGKSSVSYRRRDRSTRNQDVDGISSDVSPKSKRNGSKSPSVHGRPAVIPTIETPRAAENEDCQENNVKRAESAISLSNSRSHKSSCRCSEKTGTSAGKETVETEIKVGAYHHAASVKSPPSAKSGHADRSDVNGVDEDDSAHSKCSSSHKRPSPDNMNSPVVKDSKEDWGSMRSGMKDLTGRGTRTPNRGRTPKETAQPLDDLNDGRKESTSRQSRKSKLSKTTDQSAFNKRERNHQDLCERPDVDLSPACLPNASPSEVVSNWLRGIPADSNLIEIDDELNKNSLEMEAEKNEEKTEEGHVCAEEGLAQEEEQDNEGHCALGKRGSSPGQDVAERFTEVESRKNWESSAAVMKVLLSSSLGRCQSLPEVSPVYGRRLSTSAKGLLDCLTQLQLIEPGVGQSYHQRKGCTHPCEDIMVILQSLWLTETRDPEGLIISTDQASPPRSSSGVGMSSGSGGSGKENETPPKEEESLPRKKERVDKMESGAFSESLETKEPAVNQTDGDECIDSHLTSHSHTDKGAETVDIGLEGASTVLRPPLSKKLSQDPDPVWVLHLLKKLEKQFMNHYTEAMADFKVRWDLDDSLILDKMITELKQEVKHRVQSSIDREMKKIQGRAGRGQRLPRPPQDMNLSRESSMAEKRRRMLKVMKNQSVKTTDSLSDGETTVDLSDQRSEDEYCPCDACVRKKMEARPFKVNPMAVDAPVQMEFDLLKILQLKKAPVPAPLPDSSTPENGGDTMVAREEGRNLDIVEEEEEEETETEEEKDEQKSETKEDIVAELVLEETILEEDEGEEADLTAEEEKSIEQEDEEGAAVDAPQCQCDNHEVSDEEDVGDTEAGGGSDGVTCEGEEATEGCEGVTSGEEVAKNDDNESTEGEEAVEGGQSSSAKDEDEEDDDTAEGGTEHQTNGSHEGEEDAEDTNERRPSDLCVDEFRASEADEQDNQGDRDDEEGETDETVEDLKADDERVDKEGTLPHQFTRTSVESQPGSLEDPDVDLDPLRTCDGTRKASGGSVGVQD
ncbi:retinitis pigmentosa 1-like 1 protein [Synchiropus splendidus]|uniref:retinitis pigmentosa 1-like 1 protein n=1 Tax=Synchiropus splendidus TaxID=270530 RepID=UPI00237DFD97|nr:retinitis pigmentosa 1-like 1 protein [Synchiropus splendidus]XP_053721813.1 retinitis pigmentosa 1-like 1 protein [Synchiropus splendidus]